MLKKGCQCGWLPESFPETGMRAVFVISQAPDSAYESNNKSVVQMFMYAWLLKSDSHRRKCMPFMYAEESVQSSAAAACQMENSRSG